MLQSEIKTLTACRKIHIDSDIIAELPSVINA
jgi:hypothetical protein